MAEGVETLEDWAMLDSMDCDVIQGYFVAKPMPIASFFAWRTTWVQEHNVSTLSLGREPNSPRRRENS